MTKDLSLEEIISAATKSEKEAVKKALEKLRFALLMSHTADELFEMTDMPIYHLRLGHKLGNDEYVYTVFRWSGDQFVIYTNSGDTNGVVNGHGKAVDQDPAIIYLNKPRFVEKKIKVKKKLGLLI